MKQEDRKQCCGGGGGGSSVVGGGGGVGGDGVRCRGGLPRLAGRERGIRGSRGVG